MSLTLGNHGSTGRLYLFWLLLAKNDLMDIQSDRRINWSSGFFSKIFDMSNIVRRATTELIGWPDKSFWPTKYVNFNWYSVSVLSLTTVQWKDKRKLVGWPIKPVTPINFYWSSAVFSLLSAWFVTPWNRAFIGDHSTMERLTILVGRLNKSVAPTKFFSKYNKSAVLCLSSAWFVCPWNPPFRVDSRNWQSVLQ